MPVTVRISSADDPRLADYTRLTDVGLRTHLEAEHGLFMAEGAKVIRRAVEGGYAARSVLLAESRLAGLSALQLTVPVYVVPDEVAERLTGYRVHRGALASFNRKPLPGRQRRDQRRAPDRRPRRPRRPRQRRRDLPLRGGARGGRDPAVAAVRRPAVPAVGQGLDGRRVRHPLRPDGRVVRRPRRAQGRRLPGPRAHPGRARDPDPRGVEAAKGGRAALLFGTEGDGLSARWLRTADETVRIPMRAGVDSLNVVAAAAIACHLLAGEAGDGGVEPRTFGINKGTTQCCAVLFLQVASLSWTPFFDVGAVRHSPVDATVYSPDGSRVQVLFAALVQGSRNARLPPVTQPPGGTRSWPFAANVIRCGALPVQAHRSILLPLLVRPPESSTHLPAYPLTGPGGELTCQAKVTVLVSGPAVTATTGCQVPAVVVAVPVITPP